VPQVVVLRAAEEVAGPTQFAAPVVEALVLPVGVARPPVEVALPPVEVAEGVQA
jgi:hypothetical protein